MSMCNPQDDSSGSPSGVISTVSAGDKSTPAKKPRSKELVEIT